MTPPPLLDGRRRGLFARLVGLVLVQAMALGLAAFSTRAAFAALHAGEGVPTAPLIGLITAGVVAVLSQVVFRIQAEMLGQDYAKSVRVALFTHASRSHPTDLNQRRLGYQVLRFTGDLAALKDWPGLGLPRLVQAAIQLPAAAVVLWYLYPVFGWVALGVVIPTVLAVVIFFPPLQNAHRSLRRVRANLAADMTERLPIAPQLAALGRRQSETRRLEQRAEDVEAAATRRQRLAELLKALPEMSAAVAGAFVIAIGSLHNLPTATVAAALAALALTLRPLSNLAASLNRAAGFRAAHEKLRAALLRPTTASPDDGTKLKRTPLSVDVRAPEAGAIHVPAGASETLPAEMVDSIALTVAGAAAEAEIDLRLNGHSVRSLTPGSLRRTVGVISETPVLLQGSLRRNLVLGRRQRPEDEAILEAARHCGLEDWVSDADGLSRRVSERGANLSPEDRVAVSLLRVALQKPGLVIVATSIPFDLPEHVCPGATVLRSDRGLTVVLDAAGQGG